MNDHAKIAELRDRVALLEKQMREVYEHVDLPFEEPGSDIPDSVVALALAGKGNDAAKEYRRLTGASIQHALRVVKSIGA